MTNKQQLQLNNTNLASILSVAQNLPTGDSFKHGLYVWKKFEYNQEIAIENLSITLKHELKEHSYYTLTTNFDLNLIEEYGLNYVDFFDGFTMTDGCRLHKNNDKLVCQTATYSFDDVQSFSISSANSGIFNMPNNVTSYVTFTKEYTLAKKIIREESKEFIDYVVADTESAYPDGGEKDGFWYERVRDGITPEMFGCTKMAVDKYTRTSQTTMDNVTFPHSLGEPPKFVIIRNADDKYSFSDALNFLISTGGVGTTLTWCWVSSSRNYVSASYPTLWGETQIRFGYASDVRIQHGTTYELITMA